MEINLLVDPELIGMDADRASQVASQISNEEFNFRFSQLEALLGFDAARDVIKSGEVLTYRNGKLREYWSKASEVREQLHGEMVPTHAFHSIESLDEFMKSGIDFKGFEPQKYRILNTDEKSRDYLNTLADGGSLILDGNDRWSIRGSKGTRAGGILKVIAKELQEMFHDLKLPRPGYELNHGQIRLTVPAEVQKHLGQIRDYIDGKKE